MNKCRPINRTVILAFHRLVSHFFQLRFTWILCLRFPILRSARPTAIYLVDRRLTILAARMGAWVPAKAFWCILSQGNVSDGNYFWLFLWQSKCPSGPKGASIQTTLCDFQRDLLIHWGLASRLRTAKFWGQDMSLGAVATCLVITIGSCNTICGNVLRTQRITSSKLLKMPDG